MREQERKKKQKTQKQKKKQKTEAEQAGLHAWRQGRLAIVEGGAAFVFKLHACSRGEVEPVVDMVAVRCSWWSGRQACLSRWHLTPSACRSVVCWCRLEGGSGVVPYLRLSVSGAQPVGGR